jgi:hypothetical protein
MKIYRIISYGITN